MRETLSTYLQHFHHYSESVVIRVKYQLWNPDSK